MSDDAFKFIESLRAELFKSRAETEKVLREKEKAESESTHATLKLQQTQVKLDDAQNALDAMAKDLGRAVQERESSNAALLHFTVRI